MKDDYNEEFGEDSDEEDEESYLERINSYEKQAEDEMSGRIKTSI